MRKPFTPQEIKILVKDYPNKSTIKIAEQLGRHIFSVYNKAFSLNLKKTKEYLSSPESGRHQKGVSFQNNGSFKEGHVPSNKGKKQIFKSETTRAKSTATQFKKGNLPHNTKYDGCLSIRYDKKSNIGYVYIRISKANWQPMNRVLWEAKTGEKLTDKDNIVFKDGDQSKVVFENLVKLTHKELMARNTIQNFPEEFKDLIRLKSRLNKQITKILERKNDEK